MDTFTFSPDSLLGAEFVGMAVCERTHTRFHFSRDGKSMAVKKRRSAKQVRRQRRQRRQRLHVDEESSWGVSSSSHMRSLHFFPFTSLRPPAL